MNKEEFLKEKDLLLNSIENNTKEHWENYYKGVPIECIYDDLVIDINEIKRLTEENKQLKDNWNKLKEYLHNVDVVIDYSENYDGNFINYDELVNKIQELDKGSDNNE